VFLQLREPHDSCFHALQRALALARNNGMKLIKTQLQQCKDHVLDLMLTLFDENDRIAALTKEYEDTTDVTKKFDIDQQIDACSTCREVLLEKVYHNLGRVLIAISDMKYGAFLQPDLSCVTSTLSQMQSVIQAVADFNEAPPSAPRAQVIFHPSSSSPSTLHSDIKRSITDGPVASSGGRDGHRGRSVVRDRSSDRSKQRDQVGHT
jgi:hypothetical protein